MRSAVALAILGTALLAAAVQMAGRAVEWIAARRAEGRSIRVHCAQEHGRSATIVAAARCRLGLATGPADALAQVRAARPRAHPSRRRRLALERFLGLRGSQA